MKWISKIAGRTLASVIIVWATPVFAAEVGASVGGPNSLPSAGTSLLRVMGSLILVLGLFFVGVYLFRNWQRLASTKRGHTRLNILEAKSLGNRQALLVVGYEQQRFLVASSAAGVQLLTHLPESDEILPIAEPLPSFAKAFQTVLSKAKS